MLTYSQELLEVDTFGRELSCVRLRGWGESGVIPIRHPFGESISACLISSVREQTLIIFSAPSNNYTCHLEMKYIWYLPKKK